jgi:hypothetical protein
VLVAAHRSRAGGKANRRLKVAAYECQTTQIAKLCGYTEVVSLPSTARQALPEAVGRVSIVALAHRQSAKGIQRPRVTPLVADCCRELRGFREQRAGKHEIALITDWPRQTGQGVDKEVFVSELTRDCGCLKT